MIGEYFVRITQTDILMFVGCIDKKDDFISLLDKYLKGEIEMYRCNKQ